MEITQLTKYQHGVLCRTAKGAAPIFLMARPRPEDKPPMRFNLTRKRQEVMKLVECNLMEDVSTEFVETLREQTAKTRRKFWVFGLTEYGYLMFKDCNNRPIN